jgi:hypothetical protein
MGVEVGKEGLVTSGASTQAEPLPIWIGTLFAFIFCILQSTVFRSAGYASGAFGRCTDHKISKDL